MTVVMPSMGIPAQGMSAVQMQRTQQYKINPALRNPQQPVAGQPAPPLAVRLLFDLKVGFQDKSVQLINCIHCVYFRSLSVHMAICSDLMKPCLSALSCIPIPLLTWSSTRKRIHYIMSKNIYQESRSMVADCCIDDLSIHFLQKKNAISRTSSLNVFN